MTDIRYGIIGTGMMGIEHIANVNALDGASVTAIADPHGPSRDAALDALGPLAGDVASFADHGELLDGDHCDVLVLATPNMTHQALLNDILTTDLPVLVEKPLCTTVADCLDVMKLAERREALVWTGLEYRYMPPVARLIDEVQAGVTGGVSMVAIREHRFPFLPKVNDWNRLSANTGGTLVEKCCHFFDLMNLITGSTPVRVMASGGQDNNHLDEVYDGQRSDILDNAYVIVDFADGSRGMLDLCMFADATHNQEEISVVGPNGKVEALIPEDSVRIGRRGDHWIGSVEHHAVEPPPGAFIGLHHASSYIEHLRFLTAVRTGAPPEVSLHDGMLSVAVGEAAHRSIDEGRPVTIDEVISQD